VVVLDGGGSVVVDLESEAGVSLLVVDTYNVGVPRGLSVLPVAILVVVVVIGRGVYFGVRLGDEVGVVKGVVVVALVVVCVDVVALDVVGAVGVVAPVVVVDVADGVDVIFDVLVDVTELFDVLVDVIVDVLVELLVDAGGGSAVSLHPISSLLSEQSFSPSHVHVMCMH
jgi:hypothetical protein